jgi:transposase-like protein
MARPYSADLRERVVRAVENGASRRATAAKFEVSISFVVKLMQRWHQRGTIQPDRGLETVHARGAGRATARAAGGRAGPHDRRAATPAGG